MLQHSFAELWGRFDDFFWKFLTFFPKFVGKFWSAGSSRKPIQKTSLVPLVYDPIFFFFGFSIRSQLPKNLWYRENYHL